MANENNIPNAINDAFIRILENLSDQAILGLSKNEPKFMRGHRNIMANVGVVRNQLKLSLKKDGYLSPALNFFLCAHGLSRDIVVVLSEKVIEQCFEDMAVYFGESDFLAAMLLDKRLAVSDLAMAFISKWDGVDSGDDLKKLSFIQLQARLNPFISLIAPFVDDSVEKIKPQHTADKEIKLKLDKSNQKLKTLEHEYSQLEKRFNRENKNHQAETILQTREIDRLKAEQITTKTNMDELKTQLSEAKEKIVGIEGEETLKIQAGVDLAIKSTLREWLPPLIELDVALKQPGTKDILASAKTVLLEQQAVDRKYGNIVLIEEMIEARRSMLKEINTAQRNALRPLPALMVVAADLEKEINVLEVKIERTRIVSEAVGSLLVKINSANNIQELSAVRDFIQQSSFFGMINSLDLSMLYRETNIKAGLLYDQSLLMDDTTIQSADRGFFSLFFALELGKEFILMIDGHNTLFELHEIFGEFYENGHPALRARSELEERLKRSLSKGAADAILYFDSPTQNEVTLSDRLRVKYSGGHGEHRADNAILKDIAYYKNLKDSKLCCIVTKDRDLANQAIQLGSYAIDPEELGLILG